MTTTNKTQAEERATWIVGMWLDGNYDGEATCRQTEADVEMVARDEDAHDYELAQLFKQRVEDAIYDGRHNLGGSMLGDFAGYMLACVDFNELATTRLDDYEIQHRND